MEETEDEREVDFPRGKNYQNDVAAILLELREEFYKTSVAISFISEKFGRIQEIDTDDDYLRYCMDQIH